MLVSVEQAIEVEACRSLVLRLQDRLGVVQPNPPYVFGERTVGACQVLCGDLQPPVCLVDLLDKRLVGYYCPLSVLVSGSYVHPPEKTTIWYRSVTQDLSCLHQPEFIFHSSHSSSFRPADLYSSLERRPGTRAAASSAKLPYSLHRLRILRAQAPADQPPFAVSNRAIRPPTSCSL